MGAGNPIIRSLDDNYDPTTYFLDFSDCYSDKEEAVKEMCEANEIDFSQLSEDEINEHFNRIIEWDVESFQDDYFFNLDKKEMIADWRKPNRDERYLSECSGSFRGSAVILAMNDDTYLLTTDEAMSYHYPFGIIPRFKLEDIADELYDLHIDKYDWYSARNLDYSARMDNLAEREYDKRLDKWRKKYEPFMKTFHKHWGKIMSVRNGAWMSMSISKVGDEYQFL
jgi:hypothetical protein